MIENMIEKIKQFLPLKISHAEWDGTTLQLYGPKWNFNTLSAWRISTSSQMVFGCYDKDSIPLISLLKEDEIIDIDFQEYALKIDPVFILSNGKKIEVFSTDTFEPWTFGLDDSVIFVPTPNEPSAFT